MKNQFGISMGKMSISFETEENVEEILARADTYLKTVGYNTQIARAKRTSSLLLCN